MSFYLTAADRLLRHSDDQPTIGLILCRERNRVVVEYTLHDVRKPMGVAAYQLTSALPDGIRDSLPSVEALEAELALGDAEDGDNG